MPLQIPHWVWNSCALTICGLALWQGGRTERVGGGIILAGWLLTVAVARPGWWDAAANMMLVDIASFVALTGLAMRSHRFWPLWAAGFQLLAIVTHWAHAMDRSLGGWAYQTAAIIWGYLLLGALAVGTWGAWRERQLAKAGALTADPGATRL